MKKMNLKQVERELNIAHAEYLALFPNKIVRKTIKKATASKIIDRLMERSITLSV